MLNFKQSTYAVILAISWDFMDIQHVATKNLMKSELVTCNIINFIHPHFLTRDWLCLSMNFNVTSFEVWAVSWTFCV